MESQSSALRRAMLVPVAATALDANESITANRTRITTERALLAALGQDNQLQRSVAVNEKYYGLNSRKRIYHHVLVQTSL